MSINNEFPNERETSTFSYCCVGSLGDKLGTAAGKLVHDANQFGETIPQYFCELSGLHVH